VVPLCLEAGLLHFDGSADAPSFVSGGHGFTSAGGNGRDDGATAMAAVGFTRFTHKDLKPFRKTITGRRKRLGVPGWTCMLTGKKKIKGYFRTFTLKKRKRHWRPNLHWKKLWWDEERKWVRLFVSATAMKRVDKYGLLSCANRAGLDLYAWCRPHWDPGSRQPLPLKIARHSRAQPDKKYWRDYMPYLNKGQALCDILPGPNRPNKWYQPQPYKPREKPGEAKRLVVDQAQNKP
jgi:large subunit ribosomal protein L28